MKGVTKWAGRFAVTRLWTFLAGAGAGVAALPATEQEMLAQATAVLGLVLLDAFTDAFGFGGE